MNFALLVVDLEDRLAVAGPMLAMLELKLVDFATWD